MCQESHRNTQRDNHRKNLKEIIAERITKKYVKTQEDTQRDNNEYLCQYYTRKTHMNTRNTRKPHMNNTIEMLCRSIYENQHGPVSNNYWEEQINQYKRSDICSDNNLMLIVKQTQLTIEIFLQSDEMKSLLAGHFDHPSVYMGGPSENSKRKATKLIEYIISHFYNK